MFGQTTNYENKLFISGQEVFGVENLDISYSNSPVVSKYLGFTKGTTTVNGATQQKLSISRNLIYQDPLLSYTGSAQISGSVNYNNNSYGFKSGFLDEYMVNCAVGSIPKVSTNITIYDELKTGVNNASGSVAAPTFYIPNQGSISLTCDNSSTNRVVGFDYSVRCIRKPIYNVGSKFPTEIALIAPSEFSATVQIEVDDAFLASGMEFLSKRQNKTLSFSIKSRDNSVTLQQLSIPNASLIGESLSSSADGGVKLTLNYIGHS
jgi:hypothetical protein